MNSQEILDKLNWRYATKTFDSSKKLSAEQVNALKTAVQLAPSSYGLQPYKVIVVSNQEIKEKLKPVAYGQTQLTDASHVFVFATYKDFNLSHVDEYAENIATTRGISKSDIQGFIDVMNGTVSSLTAEQLQVWNAKQTYIALGVLLETAALLNIDACPMEGFDASAFDEILGLKDQNLQTLAIAPVGYRSADDQYQHYKKVRVAEEDLFIDL